VKYKAICVATVVFSGIFATVGVTRIVQIAVPLLVLVYPMAICLIILTIAGRKSIHRAVYIGAIIGTLSTSVFDALTAAGLPLAAANGLISHIPLAEAGFPWILPAVAGGIIGAIATGIGRRSQAE
jgi:LIVCS family branched-chain amino acid:cation transporter